MQVLSFVAFFISGDMAGDRKPLHNRRSKDSWEGYQYRKDKMEEAMRSRKLVSFMFGAMMAMAAVTGCGKQGTPAAGTSVQAGVRKSRRRRQFRQQNQRKTRNRPARKETELQKTERNRAIWWKHLSWREGQTGAFPVHI